MPELMDILGAGAASEFNPRTSLNLKDSLALKQNQPNHRFLYQMGEDVYWMEIWFYSGMKGYNPYPIHTSTIHQLAIEENLFNWAVTGYLVLESHNEVLYRGVNDYGYSMPPGMTLRSDGRNKLCIKVYPYLEDQTAQVSLDPKLWEMSFDCVIYDVQDSLSEDNVKRYKTFYFKDERQQILSERNVEWTTSKDGTGKAKDTARTMKGTTCIAGLLKQAAEVAGVGGSVKVGYTEDAFINLPDIPLDNLDTSRWDVGSEENKIFYTSPADKTVLQDINHLLNYTKSSDGYPCILSFGRNSYDKTWKLLSLSYYFKNSSKNQIETLFIDDGMENTTPHISRAPELRPSTSQNYSSKTASIITNHQYVPMVPIDDAQIVNSPVYTFDFSKSSYKVNLQNNTVESLRNKAKSLAQFLYSKQADNNVGQVLINNNKSKKLGVITKPIFSPHSYTPPDIGTMSMLNKLLQLGSSIFFQVKGLTFRTPGKFINIDRAQYDNNPHDNRMLGQWLITKVVHLFSKGVYINSIWGTKFDAAGTVYKADEANLI